MKFLFPLLLLGCAFRMSAFAAPKTDTDAFLNAGAISYNMAKTASKASGEASTLGPIYPTIGLAAHLGIIRAEVAYSLSKKDKDGNKSSLLLASAAYRHFFTDAFEAKGGLGALFHQVKGDGGSVVLNNGSSTDTYYLPARKETSRVIFIDLGLGFAATKALRVDLDLVIPGAFSERRSYSLLLQAGYAFL